MLSDEQKYFDKMKPNIINVLKFLEKYKVSKFQ
jgi:hypothetical protein